MNHWARLTWFASFAAVLAGTPLKAVHAEPWQGMTSGDADISASIDDGADVFAPGSAIVWTITVNNAGPGDTLAQVFDTFPAGASGVAWTCAPMGSGICSASGHGNLSDVVYLPAGETLTYVATASVAAVAGSTLSNTVLVGTLNGVVDPDSGNNVATDVDNVDYVGPPVVTRFNSAASPGTCLADGIETRAGITQLTIRFSQPMFDPAGDNDPHDVSNPANYRLVETGPDGEFQSIGCAGAPAGDDLLIATTSVDYSSSAAQASVHVDADLKALPAGLYRVLACAGGLQNASGIPLDGSSSGNPGADFRSDFRVLGSNLLVNPNFDHPLAMGWSVVDGTPFDAPEDADGISTSGSALSISFDGSSTVSDFQQCLEDIGPGYYRLGASRLGDSVFVFGVLHSGPHCLDGPTGVALFSLDPHNPAPASWGRIESLVLHVVNPAPAGGWSISVEPRLISAGQASNWIDSIRLQKEEDDLVFRDGIDVSTECPAP